MSESFDLSEFDDSSMLSCNIDEEKRIFISMIGDDTKLSFDFSLKEFLSEHMSDDEDSYEEDEEKVIIYGLPESCVVSSDNRDKQIVIYSESNDYIWKNYYSIYFIIGEDFI